MLFAQCDPSGSQSELETPLGLGQKAFWVSTCVFLRVFGHVGRKGVQGRGVGERVNPPPKEGLETPTKGSTDFRIILGVPWESLWAPFCDFSVMWGAKMGGCLQVHVFGDPGMEMMLECDGCMCYNQSKNCGF